MSQVTPDPSGMVETSEVFNAESQGQDKGAPAF